MAKSLPQGNNVKEIYGGFWRRGCALLLDMLFFALPSTVISVIAFRLMQNLFVNGSTWTVEQYLKAQVPYNAIVSVSFVTQMCWVFIIVWFLAKFKWQATPGKRLLGVYVARADGSRLSYKTAFFRALLPILFIMTLNLANWIVLNQKQDATENAYASGMKEYFPELQKKIDESGKTYNEFIASDDGRKDYINAFDALEAAKKDEFMAKIQTMLEKGKQYMNLLQFMPFLFGGLLLAWHLFAVFTKEKTAVHDMLLGTRVFRGKIG